MLHQRTELKERAMMNQKNENCKRICFNNREIPLKYEQNEIFPRDNEETNIPSKFFSSSRSILPRQCQRCHHRCHPKSTVLSRRRSGKQWRRDEIKRAMEKTSLMTTR
ncbi:hypothetical protein ACS0PU_008696 [Formica fusca]